LIDKLKGKGMTQYTLTKQWTTADLEKLPYDEWNRYEIIDGELLVTRAPHFRQQKVSSKLIFLITGWSNQTRLGEIVATPGVIYTDSDNVIPDLAWIRSDRLNDLLDDSGHFQGSPDLIIEILSNSKEDKRRGGTHTEGNRELKLKLYSHEQVSEYWIVDWRQQQIEVYCYELDALKLKGILKQNDLLTSSILPDFSCALAEIFD
jgi:Uma2 family endonuclease